MRCALVLLLLAGSGCGGGGGGGTGGGATAAPVGQREPTAEERADLLIVRAMLAQNGFADLAAAFDRAHFLIADKLVPGDDAPAYWKDLAGYSIGNEVVLLFTEFPRYHQGMNELIRVTAHELAHVRGADEAEARATEAAVVQKLGIVSAPTS